MQRRPYDKLMKHSRMRLQKSRWWLTKHCTYIERLGIKTWFSRGYEKVMTCGKHEPNKSVNVSAMVVWPQDLWKKKDREGDTWRRKEERRNPAFARRMGNTPVLWEKIRRSGSKGIETVKGRHVMKRLSYIIMLIRFATEDKEMRVDG